VVCKIFAAFKTFYHYIVIMWWGVEIKPTEKVKPERIRCIMLENILRKKLKKMYRQVNRLTFLVVMGFAMMPFFNRTMVANAGDATINLSANKQIIKGFGASSAWCGTINSTVMDGLYNTLGYSILRVRIEEGIGDAWSSGNFSSWAPELANAKKAVANGAIIFASPWNPPASMKSGGKLNTAKYADYANYLKAYVKYFADNGAPLYAVSLQNEPDYASGWTAWTATDLLNFLTAQGATLSSVCKVMMPESFQFRHPMSDPSLNDATVASYISIIGGHLYGAGLADYPLAKTLGKELWETEHYFDTDNMSDVMALAKEVHDCMATANMNAYTYWWITWGNGLATSSGTLFKRAYVLGQFAKYVRPGYYRVDATAAPATNVSVSAYKGSNKMVVVAVNTGSGSVTQNFVVQNGTVGQLSTYQTTSSSNMVAGPAVTVTGGSFSSSLPGQSITTFVGAISGSAVEPRAGFSPLQAQEDFAFKTEILKGTIIVTPLGNSNAYTITAYMPNGQQTLIKNGIKGISAIPVKTKGIYLITINSNGHIQRKMVSVL